MFLMFYCFSVGLIKKQIYIICDYHTKKKHVSDKNKFCDNILDSHWDWQVLTTRTTHQTLCQKADGVESLFLVAKRKWVAMAISIGAI